MSSYYDTNKATCANSPEYLQNDEIPPHFPTEGLYIGSLSRDDSTFLPALVDIRAIKGLCFLYDNEFQRKIVNRCLERLVWRIALTVPSHLCDLILFNGGNPGDAFNEHIRLNSFLFDNRLQKVYLDSDLDVFSTVVNNIYRSIMNRMSTIRCAGKKDLTELNEFLGDEARIKYQFIFLTDFPRHIKSDLAERLSQIVESGNKAGVHVILSWDMHADIDDTAASTPSFNANKMLSNMELLFPRGDRYYFRNSGHDDILNSFVLNIDGDAKEVIDTDGILRSIDLLAETAKKSIAPKILSPDFDGLRDMEYEIATDGIEVVVGQDFNDKHPVHFRLDSGDYIHSFILGQSGSGKSVLLNTIISSAILKYSPEDLMLYLLDFKGVEFNRYKGLKHTKAVLVDNSDLQMTLEVLRELKEEHRQRILLFAREGVKNIKGYNRKYPDKRIPQILFVADECQLLLKTNTAGGPENALIGEMGEILNIIATQGRSQGIHMLLATQQLDDTNISGQILKNLTECFLLMSAPDDANKLVPDSGEITSKQLTGIACYYHKLELQSQVRTFFAPDEELDAAIEKAQKKAELFPGNGEHYFCGSSKYYLKEDLREQLPDKSMGDCVTARIGRTIKVDSTTAIIPLRKDFNEHILFWGANKEEQATGVLMNALISLIHSSRGQGRPYRVLVIDCIPSAGRPYKRILNELAANGLCSLVDRPNSGSILRELVDSVKNGLDSPTILAIIGAERFVEVKRDFPLHSAPTLDRSYDFSISEIEDIPNLEIDESAVIPELTEEQKEMLQKMLQAESPESQNDKTPKEMGFKQAIMFLLREGAYHDIHILMQVDKPNDILFTDEYDVEAAKQFRHKVILKSENKYLNPFLFGQEIDVQELSDDPEHLRSYYYPEDDDPVLITPYLLPDLSIVEDLF